MTDAVAGLTAQLDNVQLQAPAFPIVSNVTAKPVTDVVDVRRLLIEQLTSPVRWTASIQQMVGAGARDFIELGPGEVLCGLVRRIDRSATCRSVGAPADLQPLPS